MSAFEDRPKRDKQLLIRLTADEKRLLEKAAAQRKITAAELVRRAVRPEKARKGVRMNYSSSEFPMPSERLKASLP